MSKDILAFPSASGGDFREYGMTLRDYFAGQALIMTERVGLQYSKNELAMNCYQYADAMLAQREINPS